jgi:hypothetical protein
MKISLLHPSRKRHKKAHAAYSLWMAMASGKHEIEHILSIDVDDPERDNYFDVFTKSTILVNPNTNVVEASNIAGKHADGHIIVLMSDDFLCPMHWDDILAGIFSENVCVLLKTYDGVQKWIVTLPIMDMSYYLTQGHIYHPDYKHMFCDTDMTHLADISGKLLVRNDITFTHAHYSTGATDKDEVNQKADSTWAQGEGVYLDRVRNNFFNPELDVFNINRFGGPHLNWLKQKLGK